jgi:hypothetical protein
MIDLRQIPMRNGETFATYDQSFGVDWVDSLVIPKSRLKVMGRCNKQKKETSQSGMLSKRVIVKTVHKLISVTFAFVCHLM